MSPARISRVCSQWALRSPCVLHSYVIDVAAPLTEVTASCVYITGSSRQVLIPCSFIEFSTYQHSNCRVRTNSYLDSQRYVYMTSSTTRHYANAYTVPLDIPHHTLDRGNISVISKQFIREISSLVDTLSYKA